MNYTRKNHKDYADLEVGDWVWTITNNWEIITNIFHDNADKYPLLVGENSYTLDGKTYTYYANPSLFTYDVINGTLPPKPEIDWLKVPVDTPVLTISPCNTEWREGYFALFCPNLHCKFYVFADGKKQAEFTAMLAHSHCKLNCTVKEEWLK